ncbi:MAG: DEAD/DEAH box helicase [Thermoflexales bacterium]|nr:DEAD/DEAH box helicase [Thermoflexales bacterium]
MSNSIHPLQTTSLIRDSYLRYLKTIYPFQDQDLRDQFWQALETPGLLVKGPLLEASPPFKTGRSIEELIEAGILHPEFRALCSDALPLKRPFYLHQDQGIEKVAHGGRNMIVATGTGSGKTEMFLIPILDHLLREEQAGTLDKPGVRALLLYPMNALANDQLKRLRRVLGHYPSITFGRYTGETREAQGEAEDAFRDQFPHEPMLDNELISRDRMRLAPPHILLTNYAMLEYLLLRPRDCEFFDGETGKHWRFIVIDEAHVYDGAAGIEIAMLLRRLKDRVVESRPGCLCCIATSATLGRGEADFPAVTSFAGEIFGEHFEWVDGRPERQDVVAATRLPMAALGLAWGQASPDLYAALQAALPADETEAEQAIGVLAQAAGRQGVSPAIIAEARQGAPRSGARPDETIDRFLYFLLRGDERLRMLQDKLAETPRFLSDLAAELFPDREDAAERLVDLVNLAVRARPDPESLSLLPARYHVFARALEGAFACLNAAAHALPLAEGGLGGGQDCPSRLFLTRREECPHCHSLVVELATCVRCGTVYIVGRLVTMQGGGQPDIPSSPGNKEGIGQLLRPLAGQPNDPRAEKAYFIMVEQAAGLDEDEAVATGEDMTSIDEDESEPYTLCLACGAIAPGRGVNPGCRCAASVKINLQRVNLHGKPELCHCLSCGARSATGIVYRFLTGQDAPVSVLATSLYQALPPSVDIDMEDLPGQGRKLLAFSDSRQDAAFFAPYLERTYEQVLRRRLIMKTLLEDQAGREGHLRLQELVWRLQRQAEEIGLFTQNQGHDERQRLMATWLMQELIALDRRISLEGLGLLKFRLVRPDRWRPLQQLMDPPWNLNAEEAWQLIVLLIDTLRYQGAVTFPNNVDARDEAFAPRNRELFMRGEQADSKAGIFSWVPTQGNNRRLDILTRLLTHTTDLPKQERHRLAVQTLSGIWQHLTGAGSLWHAHLPSENLRQAGVVHRISHTFWEVVPLVEATEPIYQCNQCRNLSHINVRGICPSYRCEGALEAVNLTAPEWVQNHYRHLYQALVPIPISAEEHTAQWTSVAAANVQERFVRGEVNALSCSTTFELGVDVGELQAVLMRNVPPTTANYVQRAGRAGRRTDSAAFALTYAQRRSHDLTHYARPERMVAGRIRPPVVVVVNEKIVRRHVHSVLFAAFFRWAAQEQGRDLRNVGDFFAPEDGGPTGPDLLRQYLGSRPPQVRQALLRIVPQDLQAELDIANWGWLHTLWIEGGDGSGQDIGILDRVIQEVADDLELLNQLKQEAVQEENYKRAEHFQRVARTVRSRDLLGFLGSRNVLPKYGFPTDVVELKTNHLPLEDARRIELQRDLRIAIAEYAPGGEVVAAKHVWVSGGIDKRSGRDWPTFHYAVCPQCGRFHRSIARIEGPCTVCGGNLFAGWPRLFGTFIIPEFGFIVADQPRKSGEARPQRFYSSRVYFAEYATPEKDEKQAEPPFKDVPSLSSAQVQVWQRYSRYGKLALVNAGEYGRGFRACHACGFAEPAPQESAGRRRRPPAHNNPRTGRSCGGTLYTYHLGHEFITDVLELRFEGLGASAVGYESWLSLLYALLEGASESLGIRRDDLDGTLYPYSAGLAPALVLLDNVPGGAGHVRRVADELPAVFKAAWERVDQCECGEETSCYECLRNFRNQPFHDQLKRGLARDLTHRLLEAAGIL